MIGAGNCRIGIELPTYSVYSSSDENSQYITELNLTSNSNAILVLRIGSQFDSLDEDSIKIINPTGDIQKLKYIDNTELTVQMEI